MTGLYHVFLKEYAGLTILRTTNSYGVNVGKVTGCVVKLKNTIEELPVPYIITNSQELAPLRADDSNYFAFVRNTVTLYTERFDPEVMKKLEDLLTSNDIPFSRSNDFDDAQMLFFTEYVVQLDDLSEEES